MIAPALAVLLLALVACGPSQGSAPQAGSASAVREPAGSPPSTHDARREEVHDTKQETKTVTAPAVLASANDSLEYKVGNPGFHGRTVVRVTGDGNAEASFERGGKTDRYQGAVPPAKLQALRTSLTSHPIDGYKPARRAPVPDEATIELTLVTGGATTHARFLDNDRHDLDDLGELVELIQGIASHVSGGKIKY